MEIKITIRSVVIYLLAAAFLFYEMGLQASPSVMTQELMQDFRLDAAGLGIVAGFYFYSYTLMQIPAGFLYDSYNPKYIMTASIVVCVLGTLFFGMTQTAFYAGLGRFLMGLGSAFAFIGVLVAAARWFPSKYFAFLVGIAQLLAALGAIGGEVPLAAAVTHIGWRHTIHLIAWMGFILALLTYFVMDDYPKGHIQQSHAIVERSFWKNLKIILSRVQMRWVALYAFAGWAPVTAFAALWGVPYLMQLYGINKTEAALACMMIWLGLGIASPIIGWLSAKIGRRCILLTMTAMIGFISTCIILYVPHIPLSWMFVLLFLFGIATSGQILTFAVIRDINQPQVLATAVGFNNMAVVAGGALFQPLVGQLLHLHWDHTILQGVPIYHVINYQIALSVVPICFLLAWLASAVFIKETFCQSHSTI